MISDHSNQHWRSRVLVIAVVLVLMVFASFAFAEGPAKIRPIEDFVDQQGTYCIPDNGGCFLFVPPIENFFGWFDPDNLRLISVDYAGLANDWIEVESGGAVSFGTETSGTVIERPLKDGRAEVHVILKTKNALTWVALDDFATGDLLFGNRAPDVLYEEAEPALGESFFELKFINTAPGAPLPDLFGLLSENFDDLLFIAIRARAKGELREDFGVPDGTPGIATVVQSGLFMTSANAPVFGGFPVERIDLKVVGK